MYLNTYNYKLLYKVLLCVSLKFAICKVSLTQAFSLFDILYYIYIYIYIYIYVNKCMILRQVFNAGKVFTSP